MVDELTEIRKLLRKEKEHTESLQKRLNSAIGYLALQVQDSALPRSERALIEMILSYLRD
jgi:hypothetical protein